MIFVLDASAAAAVLFREPDGLLVAPHLFQARRVLVPQLFHLELANVMDDPPCCGVRPQRPA